MAQFEEQLLGIKSPFIMQGSQSPGKPVYIENAIQEKNPTFQEQDIAEELLLEQEVKIAVKEKIQAQISELTDFRSLVIETIKESAINAQKQILEAEEALLIELNTKYQTSCLQLLESQKVLEENGKNLILEEMLQLFQSGNFQECKIFHKEINVKQSDFGSLMRNGLKFEIKKQENQKNPFQRSSTIKNTVRRGQKFLSTPKYSIMPQFDQGDSPIRKSKIPYMRSPISGSIMVRPIERQSLSQGLSRISRISFGNRPAKNSKPSLYQFLQETSNLASFQIQTGISQRISVPEEHFYVGSVWTLVEGSKLICTGGYHNGPSRKTLVCSLVDRKIQKAPLMPVPRYNHAQVVMGSFLYVFGGTCQSALKNCQKLNLQTRKWTKIGNLLVARSGHGSSVHNGRIFIAGGDHTDTIQVLNTVSGKFSLMRIRLAGPGRCILLSHEEMMIVLQKDKASQILISENSITEIARIPFREWWSPSNFIQYKEHLYFVSSHECFCYSIPENSISSSFCF